ncbi:ketopantoate reductase panE/ApbA domain-containing protein [Hirsutella rhossiliensis]|uniref:Ketopantoate reductase panE/ApbA domain-containing protein n=1 Tax=Hirsutella rhossiliensis TaxID=111463 RepID=A0A9P8MZM6_9HYPO|nr:ketopantoate reductase panE/ApbA domain-containing protein [Hirsutella rhossiliensis]KAH0964185.1 ketopantoate reductase panE/ApbA domain-containing protein [Hirsutella rhossiliensis]
MRRSRAEALPAGSSTDSRSQHPQFHLPAVLLPPEAARSPTVHKIHILGEDERSRFIAHALSGVYDSIELLGWRTNMPSKYRNIRKSRHSARHAPSIVETNAGLPPQPRVDTKDDRIDQLLVTGRAHEVVRSIKSVQDRVDENTTICLMHEGLGVLEDVRRKFFEGSNPSPRFILGHMSHRLAFHRNSNSVRRLKSGDTRLTLGLSNDQEADTSLPMVRSLRESRDLRSTMTPYDQWLRFKLPSVIFDTVVEPVCVLLEMSYQGLLQNMPAQRIMHSLLTEIIRVVDQMPEVEGSAVIRNFMHGKSIHKILHENILAKRFSPSQLVLRVDKGLPTDIDYLNGYFIRRGQELGLDLRVNAMVRDMIKAKHSQAIERLNSYVPVEEMSVPSHLTHRYRTRPHDNQ